MTPEKTLLASNVESRPEGGSNRSGCGIGAVRCGHQLEGASVGIVEVAQAPHVERCWCHARQRAREAIAEIIRTAADMGRNARPLAEVTRGAVHVGGIASRGRLDGASSTAPPAGYLVDGLIPDIGLLVSRVCGRSLVTTVCPEQRPGVRLPFPNGAPSGGW